MSQATKNDRVAVKTYIPREQKTIWDEHAAEMEMTLSEFIRTMVQSGRSPLTVEERRSSDENPGGNDLETAILDILQNEPATFEELSEKIIGELEEELDQTLMNMEEVNIRGQTGKYFLET